MNFELDISDEEMAQFVLWLIVTTELRHLIKAKIIASELQAGK